MNVSKKSGVAVLLIAVLALCLSVASIAVKPKSADPAVGDIQYVMYLGTNDKDTNKPICTPDEARVRAEEILIEHFGGFTIQEANGGWKDAGVIYREFTLVIYLSDTTLAEVHSCADDLIRVFNQSSILIQANETSTEFYSSGE